MSKKRQLLIDTALDLFYKNGINNIGINEVLKISGVAKRTLYKDFESKEALVLAALAQRHENFIHWLEDNIRDARSDKELIEKLFGALSRWFESKEPQLGDFRGCFFINTSAEFSDQSSPIARFCNDHKVQVRELIKQYLREPDSALLDAICLLKEGAITTAYMTGKTQETTSNCIDILNKLRQQIGH